MNNEQIEIEAKQSARRRRLRTAWKIVRYVFIALVIVVNAAIVWRLCSSSDPSSMSRLLINDRIYDAFEENNEDLKIFRQYHDTITRVERNYGYFSLRNKPLLSGIAPEGHSPPGLKWFRLSFLSCGRQRK